MKKLLSYSITVIIVLLAYSNSSIGQSRRKNNPHAPGEDIYKHYTGKLGNKEIVLDLLYGYQGSSNYGGSYYYEKDKPGLKQFFIVEPESFEHDHLLTAHEWSLDTTLIPDWMPYRDEPSPTWEFITSNNQLTGKWHSADGKITWDIDLREDYRDAVQFDLIVTNDTANRNNHDVYYRHGQLCIIGVSPSLSLNPTDAEFINKEAVKFLGYKKTKTLQAYYSDYIHINETKYNDSSCILPSYFVPIYNDHGLLVLKLEKAGMSPHNTFVTENSYLCLDIKNHKRLMPEDMLDLNNAYLPELLENATRKKYQIKEPAGLSKWLLYDKVPLTKNLYPGHKGIFFDYDQGELAKDKNLSVFLSYDELGGLLRKSFKERIE